MRDVEFHKGWDLCLCGSGGGVGGLMVVIGLVLMVVVGGEGGESIVHRSGGSVVYRSSGGELCISG